MRIVEVTMEKRIRIAMKVLVTEKGFRQIKNGEDPLYETMKKELDSGNGYVEYDYAVADEKGNTVVDWRDR